MNKFLINCFEFELDLKNWEEPESKSTKKIAGIICSNPIFNYSKTFGFLKNFLYLIRSIIFDFFKFF